jgi:hypothetical protein
LDGALTLKRAIRPDRGENALVFRGPGRYVSVKYETTQELWRAPVRTRLVRLCAMISGDPAAAEDLAQETLLEAVAERAQASRSGGCGAVAGGDRTQRLPSQCAPP